MGALRRGRRYKYRRDGHVFLAESGLGALFLDAAGRNFHELGRRAGPGQGSCRPEQGRT